MPKLISEDDVFKSVLKVLMARGYDSATTAEMAAAANIHEATLFRKYESKAHLTELALANQLAHAPLRHVQYTGDLQADLRAILQAYIETFELYGAIMPTMLLEISRHPELRSALQIPLANVQGIAQIIERYQRDGLLRKGSPLLIVNLLIGPIMVYQMLIHADLDLPVPAIDMQEYVEGFLHGMSNDASLAPGG